MCKDPVLRLCPNFHTSTTPFPFPGSCLYSSASKFTVDTYQQQDMDAGAGKSAWGGAGRTQEWPWGTTKLYLCDAEGE